MPAGRRDLRAPLRVAIAAGCAALLVGAIAFGIASDRRTARPASAITAAVNPLDVSAPAIPAAPNHTLPVTLAAFVALAAAVATTRRVAGRATAVVRCDDGRRRDWSRRRAPPVVHAH